ncbi:MAG: tRNA (N(6)-L-threonylcarbamoyladenosine(37)-C(2))-methylthiotransferase [Thermoplasmata archaeon YP2-bin.285]|uniref:tRNA-t(6)A37 methylthiotransferase n=1 Tax=Candidatus Sysuiplasma superficiale TaxID=2823368 RepID=A0A8J8CAB7_9ARCH|nr:tRNA (N(6)-L-threonylcarbamoyladenosine(37)-C(2))-methylthiotransferase [Candidatus Sysuiplasma superficiale]
MKAYIESHGCTMNYGEGRIASALLSAGGYEIVQEPSDSDIVLLNTCAVITTTERKMLSRLRQFSTMGKKIVVTGCMATTRRNAILQTVPDALIYDPGDYGMLDTLLSLNHSVDQDCWNAPGKNDIIIPLAQGCLSRCSYCLSRVARPKLRSLDPEKIVRAVRVTVSGGGVREILLSGMDSIVYGRDIGTTLPELISRILQVEGDFRLRIGMMNPSLLLPLLDDLLDVYQDRRVYRFFHIPFQSGSDRILRLMRRGNTVSQFRDIVRSIRGRYSDATLATDIIAGFPSETEEEFQETLDLIREIRPDIVNVTRFSAREGTPAANMPRQIPGWIAKERSRRATELRFSISLSNNEHYVGGRVRALVTERGKNGYSIGRLENYRQVIIRGDHSEGQEIVCRITGASPIHLIGEPA